MTKKDWLNDLAHFVCRQVLGSVRNEKVEKERERERVGKVNTESYIIYRNIFPVQNG